MFSWSLAILSLVFILVIVKYSKINYRYWKQRGVHCPDPVPIFGNFGDVCLFRKTVGDWLQHLYEQVRLDHFGVYVFDRPALVLRSPELIARVLIRDAASFVDRTLARPKHDAALAGLMFLQRGGRWRAFRSLMTPLLTAGKVRRFLPNVRQECSKMVDHLAARVPTEPCVDARAVCERLVTNALARCAFGVDARCFDNEDEFWRVGRAMSGGGWGNAVARAAYFFLPRWAERLRLRFVDSHAMAYLYRVHAEVVAARRGGGRGMDDLVEMVGEMGGGGEAGEIGGFKAAAFAVQFFFGGFDTTISTISFTLYELCLNLEIQAKARTEILAKISKHQGITYDSLSEMKYLDMCVHETLRKYPVLPFLDRACNETYTFPETNLVVEKGTPIYVPLRAIHMDEQYFPEPQKFDPDRFDGKNHNEHGLVYMPFGAGPRNCIGERFGLISTKLALVHILSEFQLERCAATPVPIVFDPKSVMLQSKVGLPMRMIPLGGSRSHGQAHVETK